MFHRHQCKKGFEKNEENKINFVEKIMEPYIYIAEAPGKKALLELCQASNFWMNIPEDKLEIIKEIAAIIYNTGLIVDDIEDGSLLRRSVPAAHRVFGTPFSINSSLYMIGVCWNKLFELGSLQGVQIVGERMKNLYLGLALDIYFRDNFICPSETQYIQMCTLKAGSLITMAVELMQLFSDKKYDFSKMGKLIGVFLQVRGDYLMCSEKYSERKSFCDDISEGKFSLPIIHAIQSRPDSTKVLNILKQKPQDYERKQFCLNLLKQYGSFEYTRKVLEEVKIELIKEIRKIGENPIMINFINNVLILES